MSDNKKIITTRLNKFLREKSFEEARDSMLAAESFGVSKSLLKTIYLFLGRSSADNNDYYSAILFLNKSREIDPASKIIFTVFVNTVKKFFED